MKAVVWDWSGEWRSTQRQHDLALKSHAFHAREMGIIWLTNTKGPAAEPDHAHWT